MTRGRIRVQLIQVLIVSIHHRKDTGSEGRAMTARLRRRKKKKPTRARPSLI